MKNLYRDILFGVAVGDALGVPVEFEDRQERRKDPVVDMREFGTHNQPRGTFSDDGSMTFCTVEGILQTKLLLNPDSLCVNLGNKYANWAYQGYWAAHGKVFDIGIATGNAMREFIKHHNPKFSGSIDEGSNGNGSLMRILPLVTFLMDKSMLERWQITSDVSAITHAHIRSKVACFIYLEYARRLIKGEDKFSALVSIQQEIGDFLLEQGVSPDELVRFSKVLTGNLHLEPENKIFGSGYVLHSLESSIWCLLQHDDYKSTVLRAVNLGDDTDTTAAIAGGLAGIVYGTEGIPEEWVSVIARREDIEDLATRWKNWMEYVDER